MIHISYDYLEVNLFLDFIIHRDHRVAWELITRIRILYTIKI